MKGSRFQSTLPREERHTAGDISVPPCRFQSTLPREERLGRLYLPLFLEDISIHAPTRGATISEYSNTESLEFQSTLPREERLLQVFMTFLFSKFQSTLPREERRYANGEVCSCVYISIHAPTRGATKSTNLNCH